MAYQWMTFVQARQQLAQRLADPANQFWLDAENGLYITEALRVWNALTFTWKTTYTFTVAAASAPTWYSLGTQTGSPRLRTLTDTALYTLMEYHLLEPATGGTWTGTSQFSISALSLALQRCRDEAIQVSNCNQANPAPIGTTPGDTVVALPDTFLDVPRARWVPITMAPTVAEPVTLVRTDNTALNYYQPGYLQTSPGTPSQYNIASLPPLSLQVDVAPAGPSNYDLIALFAGPQLNPPTPSLLNVPDDNAWVLKWGALRDLFGEESEATDPLRAQFCDARFRDGLKLMASTPWVIEAYINNVPVDCVAVTEMDWYRPEWDAAGPDYQTVVTAGIDFFTVVPDPAAPMGVSLTVLANAPVPVADNDYVQVSRDAWNAVLDYAQFLAAFKQGGEAFTAAQALEKNFYTAAVQANGRLEKLGLFADLYDAEGTREIRAQERFQKT